MGGNNQPLLSRKVNQEAGNATGLTQAFQQQAATGAANIKTDFSSAVPQLNQNYQQFNPSIQTDFRAKPGLDQFSQGLLSQAQQGMNTQLAANQNNIAQQFGANNPAAKVLQQQAAFRTGADMNPLRFQVATQQVGRQQQEQQLGNQASLAQSQERARLQGMGNETALAQQGAFNTAQSAGNAAQTLQTQLQGLPVAAQQNLIATLQGTRQGK
jgi:hypothetical protein